MDKEKVKKAAMTLHEAVNGKATTVEDFVEAINVVLDEMRKETTVQQALKWCYDKGYTSSV